MYQGIRISNPCKIVILVVFVLALTMIAMPRDYYTSSFRNNNYKDREFLKRDLDSPQVFDTDGNAKVDDNVTDEMKKIIHSLREQITREMADYILPFERTLEELIPEKGGTPVRSIVVTSWRSGSTFLGSVLESHPATFYFSEPLTDFGYVSVRGEPLGTPAVRALRNFFSCNYYALERYLQHSKNVSFLFTYNTRLWQHCDKHRDICWLPQFLSPVCKLFPFQIMKFVHLRLRLVEELLADTKLNARVVLLVRDPRGMMSSRSILNWCNSHADCGDPVRVCADLVDDYSAALRFTSLFPDRFKVVRYEEMALRPEEVIPEIFKFFGLQYHEDVKHFVKSHTTNPNPDIYSTFRNSSETALQWRQRLDPDKVQDLQKTCRVAMMAWGYLPVHNATHQESFNPLLEPFSLP